MGGHGADDLRVDVAVAWDDTKRDAACRTASVGEHRALVVTVRTSRPSVPNIGCFLGTIGHRPHRVVAAQIDSVPGGYTITVPIAAALLRTQRLQIDMAFEDQRPPRIVRYVASRLTALVACSASLALAFTATLLLTR